MPDNTIESFAPTESLEILDDLIKRYYERLLIDIEIKLKPGDLIKMIELRNKLAPKGEDQQKFWAMLSKIRRAALKSETSNSNAKERSSSNKP
ncbi:MAG: hypothetical protein IIA17_01165 [candidate division Zixibacteria bacterium]|nr:hypothetical protein [candidate division Zixibacteria bacterium]